MIIRSRCNTKVLLDDYDINNIIHAIDEAGPMLLELSAELTRIKNNLGGLERNRKCREYNIIDLRLKYFENLYKLDTTIRLINTITNSTSQPIYEFPVPKVNELKSIWG